MKVIVLPTDGPWRMKSLWVGIIWRMGWTVSPDCFQGVRSSPLLLFLARDDLDLCRKERLIRSSIWKLCFSVSSLWRYRMRGASISRAMEQQWGTREVTANSLRVCVNWRWRDWFILEQMRVLEFGLRNQMRCTECFFFHNAFSCRWVKVVIWRTCVNKLG